MKLPMLEISLSQESNLSQSVEECISTVTPSSILPNRLKSDRSSLQVFQDLSHPSAFSNSAVARRSNEGLSLLSLLSHTTTPQGNALLRQWLLSPLQSVDKIRERQDAVAFFLEPGLQDVVGNIRGSLKKAGDVQTGLKGVRRGGSTT